MTTNTPILIIGAGFAGLGMAIQLKRTGREDFVLIERANDVGGTWRDNHYPGIACDVPSHLYSYSYLPNPDWTRVFSPGGEIQSYIRTCAEDEGILPHIHFDTDMLESRWDAEANEWVVETSNGTYRAKILITGTGHLADGHMPKIDGLDSFKGEVFHSADWDHSVDLNGKRIGVIGSGASAIQIIPEMQKCASEMVVFQRSAPYMVPRWDREYTAGERRMCRRDPSVIEDMRSEIFWAGEFNFAQRRNIPRFLEEAKTLAVSHRETHIKDPELLKKLTPDYEIGCKRLLISNTYYPAIAAENTTLEASALARVDGTKAIGASGEAYELDVLIFATGFEAVRPPFAARIFGAEGISLDAHWDKGMQAYDSIAVHGYPNLFIINGPNTGLGHNSVVYIIEAQVDYILGALDHIEAQNVSVIEVKPEAEEAYMDKIDVMSQGTVWLAGGCKSWYVDERSGRLTLIWPDFAHSFRDENGRFHPAGYTTQSLTAAE
ncbi:flavin-containing monooxygenase [Celeribacter baekdonensis]|uniref:4-hydroxyacetophenone monooxygenase n=1 Tax=Celeribacter baekdonensis TaxID=875171 RepID=A0A2R4LXW9_9RHOB|nr:NAD(P)/FAD-dependent oxidoreductase [Celeribacter baekdonensis]AVW89745.1 4-hydroxyacetophenone monooxygenase [Celeribacter baekdonensis]